MQPEEFLKMLESASERLANADFSLVLEAAGVQFGEEIEGNFERQVDSQGMPWKPHSPRTIELHGVHPLLRLTYAMYQAATDLRNSAATVLIEDRMIRIGIDGNEIPYAWRQDEGAGRIPQREFYYLNEDSIAKVGAVIEEEAFEVIQSKVLM